MFHLILTTSAMMVVMTSSCELLPESQPARGLEERALDSNVVIAGYTRTVLDKKLRPEDYSAEFLVFNVMKGRQDVQKVYGERPPSALETALNRRLVNVSGFGVSGTCDADVKPGETYILLLDVTGDGKLQARYDGVYGPAVVYSRDKETALEAIGASPWAEWSACSASCGNGTQLRHRQCNAPCNDEGQQRSCNAFPCPGALNVLSSAGVHRASQRAPGRPAAYRLTHTDSWRSEAVQLPRTFPWEFSLMATLRVQPGAPGGFLLRVLHSGSLQVGLYVSDMLTLVLSDRESIRVSFVRPLSDGRWHQVAFGVRRSMASLWVDCEEGGRLPLPGKVRPFAGQPAHLLIGSAGPLELDAFQGDIEQLTITGSPDAAENQCSSTVKPFWESSQTQNDQHNNDEDDSLMDDEDFDFEGSGQSDYDYARQKKIPLKADTNDDDDDDDQDEKVDDAVEDEDDNSDESNETETETESNNEEENKIDITLNADKISHHKQSTLENRIRTDEFSNEIDVNPRPHKALDKLQNQEKHSEPDSGGVELLSVEDKHTNVTLNTTVHELSQVDRNQSSNLDTRLYSNVSILLEDHANDTIFTMSESTTTATPSIVTTVEDEQMKTTEIYFKDVDQEDEIEDVEGSGSEKEIGGVLWSEWSECSSSCGWGRRTRTSYCGDNQLRRCNAAADSQAEACFLRLCPTSTTTPPPSTKKPTALLARKMECRVRCENRGVCYPPYRCICPGGFFGSRCQYAKKSCLVSCKNGGTCLAPSKCICAKGYYGTECQFAMCKPMCENGGACVSPNTCRCKAGYVGKSCHKAVCPAGCKNGGECVAPGKCACKSGFAGIDCSYPYCEPACQNGGECIKPYFCHCPAGTRGAFCEHFSCKPDCQNGGTCIAPGNCSCSKGYSGFACEQSKCPGGCLHGGVCGKAGKCICPAGYMGPRCEKRKTCKWVEVREPYKRGYRHKVSTSVKVPCGAWDWKQCTRTKVHYEMVYKTFYRTSYECEGSSHLAMQNEV